MKIVREEGIFKALDKDTQMGILTYEWESENVFAITHTIVDEAFRGGGVARENNAAVLSRDGFQDVKAVADK